MSRRVELYYRRVHILIGVCRIWRNVGLTCHGLWSVIPLVDPEDGRQRTLSTKLALQRAGSKDLYLSICLPSLSDLTLDALNGHWNKFSAINVLSASSSAGVIHKVLTRVLQPETQISVSKLFLRHIGTDSQVPTLEWTPFRFQVGQDNPRFLELFARLSVLHIENFVIEWAPIKFTHRLVDLRISNITLGNRTGVVGFFDVLSSTQELRHLGIIAVHVQVQIEDIEALRAVHCNLPRLETFSLERLDLNVLSLFLSAMAPGSYHLTLSLNTRILFVQIGSLVPGFIDQELIYTLLKSATIHKLVLLERMHFWESGDKLRRLLESVPFLRTLVLSNNRWIDRDLFQAFAQPPEQGAVLAHPNHLFPKLEALEIYDCRFFSPASDLKEGFQELLDGHPIQRMILGGTTRRSRSTEEDIPLDNQDEVIVWLKGRVPQLCLGYDQGSAIDSCSTWQLWDI